MGILAVTSADRLNADGRPRNPRASTAAPASRTSNLCSPPSRSDALLVTVIDGHPATLSWLGAVHGHRTAGLGVEHFGQTGTVADLYRHFGIDSNAILQVVAGLAKGRPLRAVGTG